MRPPSLPSSFQEALQQWHEITAFVNHWDDCYYNHDAPEVDDATYDAFRRHLDLLRQTFPELSQESSHPLERVGPTSIDSDFKLSKHLEPLRSLDNALTPEDVENFIQRAARFLKIDDPLSIALVAEPKIDGLSVSVRYQKGSLLKVTTRGDGIQGEDVTLNARTIKDIPVTLSGHVPDHALEIRGEIYMSHEDFIRLNDQRQHKEEPPFANPRNAAAGSLRQLDPAITAQRHLRFFVHGIYGWQEGVSTYTQLMDALATWGLPLNPLRRWFPHWRAALGFWDELYKQRSTMNYDIDGVVYKIDRLDWQQRLGHSARAPRYAIAHKFPAHTGITTLKAIDVQVGRTGVLTPVAILEPINVGGVMISRASLHNADEIIRKDIRVGDKVCVERAGDVIPYISHVLLDEGHYSLKPFVFPTQCPSCGSCISRSDQRVALRCLNTRCPAQQLWRLKHFVSRHAFDIQGLGPQHLACLVDKGYMATAADLFKLQSLHAQDSSLLTGIPGWGPQMVKNLLSAIDERRHISLERFIYALGIPQIGQTTARLLAHVYRDYPTWWQAIQDILQGDVSARAFLRDLDGIGETTEKEIEAFFSLQETQELVQTLAQQVTILPFSPPSALGPLQGATIVFTGTLQHMTRSEAKALVQRLGGAVGGTITQRTTHLVMGHAPGTKVVQAREKGITILTEEEWLKLTS